MEIIRSLSRDPTAAQMDAVIAAAKSEDFRPHDIYDLANVLATSGAHLVHSGTLPPADLASTGGPSSLSTLLAPLFLRGYGFTVPKLGVPGRPAGGIDVLAQIPSYCVSLSKSRIEEVIAQCGYAHFLAVSDFAPLDAKLFHYRQRSGSQNVPALASASLLAKKIACGVKYVGLDVRVANHGNFGIDTGSATHAAEQFCEAASLAGIRAVCILTDAQLPFQPYIGRGEALIAIKLAFENQPPPWIGSHKDLCHLMAAQVANLHGASIPPPTKPPEFNSLEYIFRSNLEAQGSTMDEFEGKIEKVRSGHLIELRADKEGFLEVNLSLLRAAFLLAQENREASAELFPDSLGVILAENSGRHLNKGDLLATVRASNLVWQQVSHTLKSAIRTVDLTKHASQILGGVGWNH